MYLSSRIIVCPRCDAVYRRPALGAEEAAHCHRCGALVIHGARLSPAGGHDELALPEWRTLAGIPTGHDLDAVMCRGCGSTVVGMDGSDTAVCPHCGGRLQAWWGGDIEASWLLFVVGVISFGTCLFLPFAGYARPGHLTSDVTLYEGIKALWHRGAWDVAGMLFAATLVLPVFRCLGLGWLLWADDFDVDGLRPQRMGILRVLEGAARWTYLEVLMISCAAIASSLGAELAMQLEPGIYLFGVSSVLMCLATRLFDGRRIWQQRSMA
ncbi:paraquat-inducible protein A [Luteibacter sp. 621]|uniref:paraquat-inducible protein A n=1 Tax=Luteibacter sp. 621 TaxID=3373916 RepID=UPI003D19A682